MRLAGIKATAFDLEEWNHGSHRQGSRQLPCVSDLLGKYTYNERVMNVPAIPLAAAPCVLLIHGGAGAVTGLASSLRGVGYRVVEGGGGDAAEFTLRRELDLAGVVVELPDGERGDLKELRRRLAVERPEVPVCLVRASLQSLTWADAEGRVRTVAPFSMSVLVDLLQRGGAAERKPAPTRQAVGDR